MSAATIKDVAKAANVSPSTVSRVLSDNEKISLETKERVLNIVKELHYHPNITARNLVTKSTRTLGIIVPNEAEDLFKNPFFIQVMTGISKYSQKNGYFIMYTFSKSEEDSLKNIKSYTRGKIVDGIILLVSRKNDKCIEYLKRINFPFSIVGRPEDTKDVIWVDNDNFNAMYNAVDRIVQKGYTDIAFIGGSKDMNMSNDRLDGYKHALKTHGVVADENLIIENPNFSEECGFESMKKILDYRIPSAVVTTDDILAFGALKAMHEILHYTIPIIGFNNTPLASYQNPPLSSIDINSEKLGYYAAKLLIEKLENKEMTNTHFIVETNFIER